MQQAEIIAKWKKKVESRGMLKIELDKMNATLSTKYTHSRICEWANGRRKVSKAVLSYIMAEILPDIIEEQTGIDSTQARKIAETVCNIIAD